ncbi:MAG TPA: YibE/F family protein [Patescibacteria group bacterium]|nr:YibE/F family protein [Patescibacteria group bacterium]
MQRLILFFAFFCSLFLLAAVPSFAQKTPAVQETYTKAVVNRILQEKQISVGGQNYFTQTVQVTPLTSGKTMTLSYGQATSRNQELATGDEVILLRSVENGKVMYAIYDKYRLNFIVLILILFVVLILLVAQLKGFGSLLGLLVSISVILFFIVPRLLHGDDPMTVSIAGSLIILFVSTYIAHGISRQTTVALIATFFSLMLTALLSFLFVVFTRLSGIGNEDIASLQLGATRVINLQGLFLGGIIIGTLGALNDITTTQSAAIFELARTTTGLSFGQLVKKGFSIGREHIVSLINTLVLAYAGSSLFIFIFLVLNAAQVPYWVILNTETITDEVVATIAGSIGLILAVPIVTLLASYVARYSIKK